MTLIQLAFRGEAPTPVKQAAAILLFYGTAVLINAAVWQTLGGWTNAPDFSRALLRLLGMIVLASGILSGHKWAWWLTVILLGYWTLLGSFAIIAYLAVGGRSMNVMPLPMLLFTVCSLGLMAAVIALLIRRTSRAYLLHSTHG